MHPFSFTAEMVLRFEMASPSGRRGLLQYMVPWLENVELVEDAPVSHSTIIIQPPAEYMQEVAVESTGNDILTGSGWGSPEATKVILHNLLYITAKVRTAKLYTCMFTPYQCLLLQIPLFPPPPHIHTRMYVHSMGMRSPRRWRICGVPCARGRTTFELPSTTWLGSAMSWATCLLCCSKPRGLLYASAELNPAASSMNSSMTSMYILVASCYYAVLIFVCLFVVFLLFSINVLFVVFLLLAVDVCLLVVCCGCFICCFLVVCC